MRNLKKKCINENIDNIFTKKNNSAANELQKGRIEVKELWWIFELSVSWLKNTTLISKEYQYYDNNKDV